MGGEVTTFVGQKPQSHTTQFAMSPDELQIFYDVWEKHKTELPAMYVYVSKQAMASTVRSYDYPEEDYVRQKRQFETWLKEVYAGTDIVVTGTAESTEVHAANAGKNAGALNIIEWLAKVSDIHHDTAICVGDSHNDYEMARAFADAGFSTTFVFTGEKLSVDREHQDVRVIDTAQNYTDGTDEFLCGVIE